MRCGVRSLPPTSRVRCIASSRDFAANSSTSVRASLSSLATGYLLNLRPEQLDATYFEVLVEQATSEFESSPQSASLLLDQALSLWRGAAYEGFAADEFARARATYLTELRANATQTRIECALRLGDDVRAIELGERLCFDDPFREQPRGQLMVALYRAGRQSDALAGYDDFRARLADELGLDPSPRLQQIQLQILNADPTLLLMQPPGSSAADGPVTQPVGKVPAPNRQGLIGRAEDEAALVSALATSPVVTLTGPGGVGKTSLALAVANRLKSRFSGGVWWCELAALTAATRSRRRSTTTLGFQTRHDGDPTSAPGRGSG